MHHERRSPRRPRKTKTWPDSGCRSSTVWTWALKPIKPRRISVTPAAIQMRVFAGRAIIRADAPEPRATLPHRQLRRSAPAPCRPSVQSSLRNPAAGETSRRLAVQRACLAAAASPGSPLTAKGHRQHPAADPRRCPADRPDTTCASPKLLKIRV